jgi:peptidoglycan-N-acetylglucosamine deacetylase
MYSYNIVMIFYIISLVLFIYYVVPYIIKIIIKKIANQNNITDKNIYITFDDGPNSYSTIKILEILKFYRVKGTFFLIGKNIKDAPNVVENIIKEGHTIGEHGYTHLHPWKTNPLKYGYDLIKSNEVYNKYNNYINNRIYRPPFGKLNIITILYLLLTKKKCIFWSIDPKDYNAQSGEEVANKVINKLDTGRVILLHDGRIKNSGSNKDVTISSLEIIIKHLKLNNYNFKQY